MELGLVGLGKMGGNMRERIRRAGHTVIGYDRNPDLADQNDKLLGPQVQSGFTVGQGERFLEE